MTFDLDEATRAALLRELVQRVDARVARARDTPLAPSPPGDALAEALARLAGPNEAPEVLRVLARGLDAGQVHTAHPRYFGLLSATPASVAVAAAALVAAYNPQLATYSHAPFAVALEDHLLGDLAERFGLSRAKASGVFTSGGAEANATALFVALAHVFPEAATRGLRALPKDPVAYVSSEAHPTLARAARLAGLGADAVRSVPVDAEGRMKVRALAERIGRDRAAGARPFFVAATVGTTNAGAIDPLAAIADVADRAGAWLHVDAAFGGLLALVPELRSSIAGVERAASITFDPHKALASPLGTGALLVKDGETLSNAFRDRAGYMPRDSTRDPYARSKAWSRPFSGAAVYAVVATAGWDGVAAALRHQVAMAGRLRAALEARAFRVVSATPLPVVCFVDASSPDGASARHLEALRRVVLSQGRGYVALTRFANGARALRACVTSYRTSPEDVEALADGLDAARPT